MQEIHFKKRLKPSNVFSISLGSIIGFACFVLPGTWLKIGGPIGVSVAFIVGSLITIVIGISYGSIAQKLPVSGGAYAYAYKLGGRKHAYLCGWLLSMGFLSVISLNATALPIIVDFIKPGILKFGYLYSIANWDIYLGETMLSLSVVIGFGILNIKGADVIGKLQTVMVGMLLLAVILLLIGSSTQVVSPLENLQPYFPKNQGWLYSIAAVLGITPFAFVGFETVVQTTEEYDFSPKLINVLLVSSILIGGLLYVIVSFTTGMAMPWTELVYSNKGWATGIAMMHTMGYVGTTVLVIGVSMAICTGINGFYLGASRLIYSMGKAKVLPEYFKRMDQGIPSNAITFTMIVSLIAPWFGRVALEWIVEMCAVGTTVSYLYTCLAAYKLGKKDHDKHVWVFGIGFLFALIILALLIVPGMPAFMSIPAWIAFLVWCVLGGIFYLKSTKKFESVSKEELDYLILGEKHHEEFCPK